MANNIDNLNFKVILDDREFNTKIKADLKLAKDLNTQMSQLLDVQKKLQIQNSAALGQEKLRREQQKTASDAVKQQQQIQREQDKTAAQAVKSQETIRREQQKTASQAVINSQKELKAKLQTATAQERLNRAQRQGSNLLAGQSGLLRQLGTYAATYFSVRTVTSFISSLVRVSGEFELQHQTLKAILQDTDGADKIFNQLQKLAVVSPFSFSDLTSYAKQLSAFSVPMEELYDTTKMLADVSAGLGVDMSRIILAYGQIRSAAFLRGQEVRQLTESGIPILAELAKQFSEIEGRMVSAGEVFDKISLREVPFEMVEKVFKNMTSEGGKFYNMQEVQAETLKAKVKNLGDQYDIMLYQIGQAQDGLLKGSVNMLANIMQHWESIGRVIVTVTSAFGAYAAALAAAWTIEKARTAIKFVDTLSALTAKYHSLTRALTVYTRAMTMAGSATKAGLYGAALGAVTALGMGIAQLIKSATELNRELDEIADTKLDESSKTIDGLNTLVSKLDAATKGSQDYRDAIHELNNKYGDYLPNLITEKNTLDEIKVAANSAAEAIRNKAQASALAEGSDKIGAKYSKRLNSNQNIITSSLKTLFPSVGEKDAANIFKLFKDMLDSGETDSGQAMMQAVDAYLGQKTDWVGVGQNSIQRSLWDAVSNYAKNLQKWDAEIAKYNEKLGIVFDDDTPQSKFEQESLAAIDAYYAKREQAIRKMQLSEEEAGKMLEDLQVERLKNEILFYTGGGISLGDTEISNGVVRNDIAQKKQAELAKLTARPTKGARLVQEALASVGVKSSGGAWGLWADETTSFTAGGYYKTLDEQWQSVEPDLKRAKERFMSIAGIPFDGADIAKLNEEAQSAYNEVKSYEKKRDAVLAIAENLGYNLGSVKSEKGSKTGKSPEQTAIELRIDAIKELQSVYKSLLKDGYSSEDIDALMDIYFANVSESVRRNHDYWAMLSKEADNLAKYDATAAAKLRTDISGGQMEEKGDAKKDELKKLAESQKYLAKTEAFLKKLQTTTKDVFGEGLALSIREALQDLEEEDGKITQKAEEMRQQIAQSETAYRTKHSEEEWDAYKKSAEDAVNAWVEAERRASHDVRQEKIKDLGNSFLTEFFKDKHKDVSRLDQKTLNELESILKLISDNLSDGDIEKLIPEELKTRAKAVGISLEDIIEAIKAARDEQEKVLDEKFWDKLLSYIDTVCGYIDDLGDALAKFGDWGESLGAAFSAAGSVAKSIATMQKSFKLTTVNDKGETVLSTEGKLGLIGTAVSAVSDVLSTIGDQIEANKEAQEEWAQTVLSTELEYRRLMLEKYDYEESNVFGIESPYEKAKAGLKQYEKAAEELRGVMEELGAGQVQTGTKQGQSAKNNLSSMAGGAAAGAAIGSAIGGWALGIGTAIGAVVGAAIGLFSSAATGETVAVYDGLLNHYGSLLDTANEEDPFALNPKIIADYDKLDDKTKEIVDHWDEVKQMMEEAQEALEETISEFAGDMGTELRDSLVEAFRNNDLYSAIDDFHDYVTEVLEDLLAQTVFAAAFQDMFDKLQADLEESDTIKGEGQGNGKTWEQIIAEFGNGLEERSQLVFDMLEDMQAWGEKNGYDLFGASGSDSTLGSGIQSITEDTANLLASYLNAIRADVSYMRLQQTEGWTNVKLIASRMPSPTVWEQIAQIEAHAYDIAKSNANILAELRSVITTEHGSPAVAAAIQ
jgi:DNA repair exonuclease SbcCD ATPase subunit